MNPNGASTASPEASPAGRILVIDDEPANLALLHRILTAAGYESVELLADSRQALARYAAWRPDLVLLDLHMPHLDGLGVLAQLRGEIPSQEFLPVVILTGDATAETRKRALSAGAHDFIVKPFGPGRGRPADRQPPAHPVTARTAAPSQRNAGADGAGSDP